MRECESMTRLEFLIPPSPIPLSALHHTVAAFCRRSMNSAKGCLQTSLSFDGEFDDEESRSRRPTRGLDSVDPVVVASSTVGRSWLLAFDERGHRVDSEACRVAFVLKQVLK